jgi:hypothetical protein
MEPDGHLMSADREVVLEESLQQSLTQLKTHTWTVVEALSQQSPAAQTQTVDQQFDAAALDLDHTLLLQSMLTSTADLTQPTNNDPKKAEDVVAFRHLSQFFQTNADRFLRRSPVYHCDFQELSEHLAKVRDLTAHFYDDFVPFCVLQVSDYFVVKLVFSLDRRPTFVTVHSAFEIDRSPFEQSDFRVFRTLAVYFSRVLPDFTLRYGAQGLLEFIIWLKCYNSLLTMPCAKCRQLMERDLTGDLLPPIVRNVATCLAYHIKCAPFEIELPDFGYVTLMSEAQLQEEASHLTK